MRRAPLLGMIAILVFGSTACSKFLPFSGPSGPAGLTAPSTPSCRLGGIDLPSVRCLRSQVLSALDQVRGKVPGELSSQELRTLEAKGLLGGLRHSEDFWLAIEESLRTLHSDGRPALQKAQAERFFDLLERHPEWLDLIAVTGSESFINRLKESPELGLAYVRDVVRPALRRTPDLIEDLGSLLEQSGGRISPVLVLRWSAVGLPFLKKKLEQTPVTKGLAWQDLAGTLAQAATAYAISRLESETMMAHRFGQDLKATKTRLLRATNQALEIEERARERLETSRARWLAIRPQAIEECPQLDSLLEGDTSPLAENATAFLDSRDWRCLVRAVHSVAVHSDQPRWVELEGGSAQKALVDGAIAIRAFYVAQEWGLADFGLVRAWELSASELRLEIHESYGSFIEKPPEPTPNFWELGHVRPVLWSLAGATQMREALAECFESSETSDPNSLGAWTRFARCAFDPIDAGLMTVTKSQLDVFAGLLAPVPALAEGLTRTRASLDPFGAWSTRLLSALPLETQLDVRNTFDLGLALLLQPEFLGARDPSLRLAARVDWFRLRDAAAQRLEKLRAALKMGWQP